MNVDPLTHTSAVLLPTTGVFGKASEKARTLLAGAGRFHSLPHGHYVATQGEPHDTMSLLIAGTMRVYVRAHADTLQVATLHPGETVGEMNLLDPVDRASADVVIGEPAVVFTITRAAFQELLQRDPGVGLELVSELGRELCQRLRKTSETMLRQTQENRSNFRDMDY